MNTLMWILLGLIIWVVFSILLGILLSMMMKMSHCRHDWVARGWSGGPEGSTLFVCRKCGARKVEPS